MQRYKKQPYKKLFSCRNNGTRARLAFGEMTGRYSNQLKKSISPKKQPCKKSCSFAVITGLEPATPCVTGRYSNQLNYHTVFAMLVPCGIAIAKIALFCYIQNKKPFILYNNKHSIKKQRSCCMDGTRTRLAFGEMTGRYSNQLYHHIVLCFTKLG